MTRITSSTESNLDLEQIENHEPYKGTLKHFEVTVGSPDYGSKKQLTVDWELDNGDSPRDWIGLTLRSRADGTPSKLTQLLNALSDKPADTPVEWFDPDTFEWSYVKDGAAFNKLTLGTPVIFRGEIGKRSDGQGRKYTIKVYQAPKKVAVAAAKTGKLKSATEEEIPF